MGDEEMSKHEEQPAILNDTVEGGNNQVIPSTPPPELTPTPTPSPSPLPACNSPPTPPSTAIENAIVGVGPIENADDPGVKTVQQQQLKPPTRAELRARAAKENEEAEAKRMEMDKNNSPVIDQAIPSKPRPKPRPKRTTEAEIASYNAHTEPTEEVEPLLPANVVVWALGDGVEVPSGGRRQRNLTDEGKRQAAEKAEKEAKRQARLNKAPSKAVVKKKAVVKDKTAKRSKR